MDDNVLRDDYETQVRFALRPISWMPEYRPPALWWRILHPFKARRMGRWAELPSEPPWDQTLTGNSIVFNIRRDES